MFTGLIEEIGSVLWIRVTERGTELEIAAPGIAKNIRTGHSVAVNGISLTVAEILPESFAVWVIPQTRRSTNLQSTVPGDQLNVEFDILAKYIERMLAPYAPQD